MKQPHPADALRLFLIASVGLVPFACGGSATSTSVLGDGDVSGDGDGDGDVGIGDGDGDGDIGTGDGDGDVPPALTVCTNPTPLVPGVEGGVYRCDEGFLHRQEPGECPFVPGPVDPVAPTGAGGAGNEGFVDLCSSHEECDGDYPYCATTWGDFGTPYLACHNGCATDADCAEGWVCVCGEEYGTCHPPIGTKEQGGCQSDADCARGELCVGVRWNDICGAGFRYEFGCTPYPTECAEGFCGFDCWTGAEEIVCQEIADCGRPFLVEGEKRIAFSCLRDDWSSTRAVGKGEPESTARRTIPGDDDARSVAAAHFEKIALMEHASIAAFARFSLQLLSLGAPARFIEETNQALVDETKHARLAFALASRFGGRPMGPGPLAINGALGDDSVESILETTIVEGCVGETLAALEARAALVDCRDDEISRALLSIAEDEERHAALAWKVVKWLLEERPRLRAVAGRVFDRASSKARGLSRGGWGEVSNEAAPELGVLSRATVLRVHDDAWEKVIRPCAEQLLGHRSQISALSSDHC